MKKILHVSDKQSKTKAAAAQQQRGSSGSKDSMKKHDRERILKYIWKDLKNKNTDDLLNVLNYDAVNLQELDPTGSLLSYAANHTYLQGVKVLLDNDSPVCPDEKSGGLSPIHIAVKNGNKDLIQIFLDHNVPLDIVTMYEQKTSLHIAVKSGHVDIAGMLVSHHGANPNIKDIYGSSPLHTAVTNSNSKMIIFLLQNNADINIFDNEGWTPLHTAVISAEPRIIKLLLNNQAHINAQTKYGKTPLHLACKCNNLSAVTLLLDSEASISIQDCHGKTAVDYTTHRDIRNLTSNIDYHRSSSVPQMSAAHVKHISMKLRSKSLIDLMDVAYANQHYFTIEESRDEPLIRKVHGLDTLVESEIPQCDHDCHSDEDDYFDGNEMQKEAEIADADSQYTKPVRQKPMNTFYSVVNMMIKLKREGQSMFTTQGHVSENNDPFKTFDLSPQDSGENDRSEKVTFKKVNNRTIESSSGSDSDSCDDDDPNASSQVKGQRDMCDTRQLADDCSIRSHTDIVYLKNNSSDLHDVEKPSHPLHASNIELHSKRTEKCVDVSDASLSSSDSVYMFINTKTTHSYSENNLENDNFLENSNEGNISQDDENILSDRSPGNNAKGRVLKKSRDVIKLSLENIDDDTINIDIVPISSTATGVANFENSDFTSYNDTSSIQNNDHSFKKEYKKDLQI